MVNCSAIGCNNRSEWFTDGSVSFHRIPSKKNNALRQQWLHNIRREGELPKDSGFYICSTHFEDDCFERDMQVIIYSHFTYILVFTVQKKAY